VTKGGRKKTVGGCGLPLLSSALTVDEISQYASGMGEGVRTFKGSHIVSWCTPWGSKNRGRNYSQTAEGVEWAQKEKTTTEGGKEIRKPRRKGIKRGDFVWEGKKINTIAVRIETFRKNPNLKRGGKKKE